MRYKHKETSYNGVMKYLSSKDVKADYNNVAKIQYEFLKENNLKPAKGKSYKSVFGNSEKIQDNWKSFTKHVKSKKFKNEE